MPTVDDLTSAIGEVAASALSILLVVIVAYVILLISRRFVLKRLVSRLASHGEDPEARAVSLAETQKRVDTISSIADWLLRLMIVVFTVLAVLFELGLTSVIVVLAVLIAGVALVAQDVIRDYVGGAVILLENQFGIGDWVQVAGVSGEVESLNLHRTTIRSDMGDLITVPNGEIRVAVNQTRIWARINFEVGIVDPTRVEDARAVIDAAGLAFAADPELGHAVLDPPQMLRVSGVDPGGIRLLIRGRVTANERWRLNGEFRKRVIEALTNAGIELVTAQRVRIAEATPLNPTAPASAAGSDDA